MKIIKQTGSRLILKDGLSNFASLLGWGGVLGGLPLVMAGLIMANAGVTQLSCQRQMANSVTCEQTQSRMLGLVQDSRRSIGDVTGTEVRTELHSRSDGYFEPRYRLLLGQASQQMEVPISEQHYEIAEQIDLFLQSTEPLLLIEQDTRMTQSVIIGVPLLLLFSTITLGTLLRLIRLEVLEFDRLHNRFHSRQWKLFRWRERSGTLADVTGVQIRDLGRDEPVYSAELQLASGQRHKLAASLNQTEIEQFVDRIKTFLQIDDSDSAQT
ncbi:MAG: hypothetical protein EA367_11795 [Leptolyngbya sp. DLM2.Bin15]|nr:MAG: hypothetical protein EA367_11795 [Leptolyngbya sp. DLM2.Bin15]